MTPARSAGTFKLLPHTRTYTVTPAYPRGYTGSRSSLAIVCGAGLSRHQNLEKSREHLTFADHSACRVEEFKLTGVELVLANERAILDAPQPLADTETGQQLLFGPRQTERPRSSPELIGFLPVDDSRLRVGEKTACQGSHRGTLVTNILQVGQLVEDQHVRDPVVAGEPPVRIHPTQQRRMRHEAPCLVVDAPALTTVRVE